MKNIIGSLLVGLGIFTANLAHAQTDYSPPQFGTFFLESSAQNNRTPPPWPCDPYGGSEPMVQLTNGAWLIEDTPEDFQAMQELRSAPLTSFLSPSGGARMSESMDSPFDFGGGGGSGDEPNFPQWSAPTNYVLWLEITNVDLANGAAYLNLHNASNYVYEIFSKTNLADATWDIASEVFPSDTNCQPFNLPLATANSSLFFWSRDWTGITSLGNTVPEWWFWFYYHRVDLSDTNLDDQNGLTLLFDYTNHLDPTALNVIQFSVSVTNNDINTNLAPVRLNISAGVPFYISIADSTNFIPTGTTWYSYTASNIVVNLSSMEGKHDIWIGLRSLLTNAPQTWHETTITLDTTPPQLLVTSPTTNVVSTPIIQVQGLANEPVTGINYSISNAAGIFTNQTGYVTGTFYDTNLLAVTTNYFQCYDVPLTNGANTISLHATDLAGNTTTTNFSVTLDYSTDTNPPVLNLIWPQDGTTIAGDSFTLQAHVDDWLATVAVSINGSTNLIEGSAQRDGTVLMADLPLASGTNTLSLTATDAAGNSTVTNISVIQNAVSVTMNPLGQDQLGQTNVNVSGTISDTNDTLTVNGVSATVNADGTWTATGVFASASGSTPFNLQPYDPYNNPAGSQVSVQTQVQAPALAVTASYSDYGSWENVHGTDYDVWQNGQIINHVTQDCWQEKTSDNNDYWSAGQREHRFSSWDSWDYVCTDPVEHHPDESDREVNPSYGDSASGGRGNINDSGDNGPPDYQPWSEWDYWWDKMSIGTGRHEVARQYTVRAWMNDDSDYGLPFDDFKIQGRTLTEDTATGWDGTPFGKTTVTVPAGVTNADVTPMPTVGLSSYDFYLEIVKDKQYWQNMVMDEIDADSGVTIENYKAGNGFLNNRANIKAVYLFYQKIFREQPTHFYWAGLGRLADGPVYAGLSDAEYARRGLITSGFLTLDNLGATIASAVLAYKAGQFQTDLIQINIDIYNDLDWQFEAYRKGGLAALEEINTAVGGNQNVISIDAWRVIDEGIQNNDDDEIREGNRLIMQREQQRVVVNGYNNLSNLFPGTTSLMSIMAKNPIIGGPNFSDLEPNGNLANTDNRWDWMSRDYTSVQNTGILPLWLHVSDSTRLQWDNQPLEYRAQQFSYAYELFSLPLY